MRLAGRLLSSKAAAFLAVAAAGGIVGNAAYDMLKTVLAHVMESFSEIKRTRDAVQEIADNAQKIRTYMDTHEDVRASQISSDLDISAHKIEPIMKLLGCRSRRVKKRRVWRRPKVW